MATPRPVAVVPDSSSVDPRPKLVEMVSVEESPMPVSVIDSEGNKEQRKKEEEKQMEESCSENNEQKNLPDDDKAPRDEAKPAKRPDQLSTTAGKVKILLFKNGHICSKCFGKYCRL